MRANPMREMIVDIFAGGGGASLGIEQALGVPVDLAVNHDEDAIAMHRRNHPGTVHGCADVWSVNPMTATGGRPVGLAWFSPDCTHFSRAKGGKPVEKRIRSLAWVVVRWARAVRPRVIILENVPEFREWGPLDAENRPDKAKKGDTYHLWCNQLRGLGYRLESRELRACDYGAPTIRKRLFVIARCDGQPIVWPEPTHGEPGNLFDLPAWRTAAECIDWSLPCPSIFERQRPLAENTLKRIARGIRKYVLDAGEPFIVRCAHGTECQTGRRWGRGEHSLTEPLPTVTASKDFALVSPTLIQTGYGERRGQAPRTPGLSKPLGTLVGTGKHALVSAFLAKHFGGVTGVDLRAPAPTVTAIDHNSLVTANLMTNTTGHAGAPASAPVPTVTSGNHQYLVASHLTKMYGTATGSRADEPVPTVTGGGQHVGEVRAFLLKYYGTAVGQDCREALHTVTAKHRLGLVTVQGEQYQIADIGLRMLTPRELARAQGFPDEYVLTGSKSSQVAKIGNSVCPPIAAALVRANVALREVRQTAVV